MPWILAAAAVVVTLQGRGVDPNAVENCVQKGVGWLKSDSKSGLIDRNRLDELVLFTLAHAGMDSRDPVFKEMLSRVLSRDLTQTYNVALQAMLLEEIQRVRYQERIWMCAQFLVDNQGPRGQWGYGQRVSFGTPTVAERSEPQVQPFPDPDKVVVFDHRNTGGKPPVTRRLSVSKHTTSKSRGDNSNSQYAALGLRACHDAGIVLPKSVVERARAWWIGSLASGTDRRGTPTGSPGGGWGYEPGGYPYGSMTAGGLGALVICDHILGRSWKAEPAVRAAATWLGVNFAVDANPVLGQAHHYYYLYGLERAGMLSDARRFGRHDWYAEGAALLLKKQRAEGSWEDSVTDTCFAILFLKRATRPLVATPSRPR